MTCFRHSILVKFRLEVTKVEVGLLNVGHENLLCQEKQLTSFLFV